MQDLIDYIKSCPLRHFSKGDVLPLHMAGSPILWAVQSGYVKVSSVDALGNEQFLWIKVRLDIVPSERLFSRLPSEAFFYTALCDVNAYELPKERFLEQARGNIEIMSEISRSMSSHYDDLLTRLQATEEANARNKLIHTLHHIARKVSAGKIVNFHQLGLQLTHDDISKLIGSTRETTATELKKLKDEGLIDYSRAALSVNTDKLNQLL
jgi:CRP-like cAMP-binding protein